MIFKWLNKSNKKIQDIIKKKMKTLMCHINSKLWN